MTDVAPISDTFTFNSIPAFLKGRIRRSYALVSKGLSGKTTRRSSYTMTFHQFLGVPGLGIGVTRGRRPEQVLFLAGTELEVLVCSIAGEKERKLPDVLLKYLRLEKREFVRDWMKGYINLERDDDEFIFAVDAKRVEDREIWVEYVGTFDGMGGMVRHRLGCGKCEEKVIGVPVSRMDVVM